MVGNTRKPVSRMDPQARHDQALRVPDDHRIAERGTLEATFVEINGAPMKPVAPLRCGPIEILELDPWSKTTRAMPDGATFVCAYDLNYCAFDSISEAAFLVRGKRNEMWLTYPSHHELKDLRRKRIPAQLNGILVAAMPLTIEPTAAAQNLMEALVEARALYASPDAFLLPGLLDKKSFALIMDSVEQERSAHQQEAVHFAETPIVIAARECGLNPNPSGTSGTAWLAQCPGTNHFLMIGAAAGEFGCGWCKRRGGIDELRAFAAERRRKQNQKAPPSGATAEQARKTERELFAGLAKVRVFPMDPNGPGTSPGHMLPFPVPKKDA